jgi:hypothetical protein
VIPALCICGELAVKRCRVCNRAYCAFHAAIHDSEWPNSLRDLSTPRTGSAENEKQKKKEGENAKS